MMNNCRTLSVNAVSEAVAALCVEANLHLPKDVATALELARQRETGALASGILDQLAANAQIAAAQCLPLCQDTGLAVFFVELGRDLRLANGADGAGGADGDIYAAINEGVRRGYAEGFLRKSVCDPFSRANTGDNTPAVIHLRLVPGRSLRIVYMAKGGGSENMSRVTMLAPAEGWEGIKRFVLERVREAGGNPCPPIIVGLGIGGNFELAPLLAKEALLRCLDEPNPQPDLRDKEAELLELINDLGVGPMGLGGRTTCLGVLIKTAPCHIASLPLAVNIQCHSARHGEVLL